MSSLKYLFLCCFVIGCSELSEPEIRIKAHSEQIDSPTNYADPLGHSVGSRLGRSETEGHTVAPQGVIRFPFGSSKKQKHMIKSQNKTDKPL